MFHMVKKSTSPKKTSVLLQGDLIHFNHYVDQFLFLRQNNIVDVDGLIQYREIASFNQADQKKKRQELYVKWKNEKNEERRICLAKTIEHMDRGIRQCRKELAMTHYIEENASSLYAIICNSSERKKSEKLEKEGDLKNEYTK